MALIVTHLQENEGHLHYVKKYRSRFLSYGSCVIQNRNLAHGLLLDNIPHTGFILVPAEKQYRQIPFSLCFPLYSIEEVTIASAALGWNLDEEIVDDEPPRHMDTKTLMHATAEPGERSDGSSRYTRQPL